MAEIFKRKTEDTYDTESIKKSLEKKEKKKEKKNNKTKKVEKNQPNKKGGFKSFCHGVAEEFRKIHWPSKKDMVKYSTATIFFILFFGAFFYIIDVILGLVLKFF